MAEYTNVYLTKRGRTLQLKAESGVRLNFTKFAIGDGQHDQSINIEDIESLLSPRKDLGITGIQVEKEKCKIHSAITNAGITEGFYIRELGLYAQDPDDGEILYGIALAIQADYLPAAGGTTVANNEFAINLIVANATDITAIISNEGYVSKDQFNQFVLTLDTVKQLAERNELDISQLKLRMTNIEQSFFNNFTSNHFTEDLNTLDDVIVTRGVYDAVNKRLVI